MIAKIVIDVGAISFLNENKKFHRINGPAIVYRYSGEEWRINGNNHRLDGPSIIWTSGDSDWYIHGECTRRYRHER